MKKVFLIIVIIHCSCFLEAGIITVDNKVPSIGNYNNIQSAIDNSNSGDVILVYSSQVPYQGFEVTNQYLSIVGYGWGTSYSSEPTTIINGTVRFLFNSEHSSISSFSGNFNVTINANRIEIRKCILHNIIINEYSDRFLIAQNRIEHSAGFLMSINSNSNGIIKNNIIDNYYDGFPYGEESTYQGINVENSSVTFERNLFKFCNSSWHHTDSYRSPLGLYCLNSNIIFENNIAISGYYLGNTNIDFRNNWGIRNIQTCRSCFGWSSGYANSSYLMFPEINNNINGVDISELFSSGYHVYEGSIAKTAASDGGELSIYGGDAPFVDGGYPDIPIIYQFEAASTATRLNGVKVKIKAKSNK